MKSFPTLKRNLSLLVDFYEITMANGYFLNNAKDEIAVFDMFFRQIPDNGGFVIFAGLQQLMEYLENLSFSDEDIDYLRSKGIFCEEFLEYLRNFKFECDVWAVKEGTPVFIGEPIVTVRGPAMQAQLIETMVLLSINFQSLIATKANRMVRAANGRPIMEFGSRRAQGYDAAILGARAAYIGGCAATACTLTDITFKVPAVGTMAHSWVQLFDSEYDAFTAYAKTYPQNCTLLVDTYSTLKSGVPNAIRVFDEVIVPLGYRPTGIRIDSGDIAYLSKKARIMLDEAGYSDVPIIVSNSLDEYIIRDLLLQDAKIDSFGIGEKLITSFSSPVLGGVYKLAAVKKGEVYEAKIKLSESVEKITTPGLKKVYRIFSKESDLAVADYITLWDEHIDESEPLEIFAPDSPWKRRLLTDYKLEELLVQVFSKGKKIYESPSLSDIKNYCVQQLGRLWEEVKRFEYPHRYYVDLSKDLWDLKQKLIYKNRF